MISTVCRSFVRLVNKMLTGILHLIATSYANSTCEKDLICSFFFVYDEEVTKRKKNILGHFAATEACKQPCINFVSSCSSEMSIIMLIFGRFDGSVLQSTTDEDCMFLFNWI